MGTICLHGVMATFRTSTATLGVQIPLQTPPTPAMVCSPFFCSRGVTGKRAAFRPQCLRVYGFESLREHQPSWIQGSLQAEQALQSPPRRFIMLSNGKKTANTIKQRMSMF